MEKMPVIFQTSILPVLFPDSLPDIAFVGPTEFQIPIFEILPKPSVTFLVIGPIPLILLMSFPL